MLSKSFKLLYLITFISGAAGLIYEIIWTRMLILIFGSSTHSVVAVISAFLGGLALGSLFFGHLASKKSPASLLSKYSYLEFGIGAGALLTLILLPLTNLVYSLISDGSSLPLSLLLAKFILTSLILLVPTTLMGGTFPVLMGIFKLKNKSFENQISLLYALNTLGAVMGVMLSAFITIELFGLTASLVLGVFLNFLAGLLALFLKGSTLNHQLSAPEPALAQSQFSLKERIILFLFGLSGLTAIAYEVLWTRALTPLTGTFIYAFASILTIYLTGLALGSLAYNFFQTKLKLKNLSLAVSELAVGFFALVSVFIISNYSGQDLTIVLVVIFPASFFMGLSFPSANALLRCQSFSKLSGISYFSNTLGCIIGGVLASFLLIPFIGTTQSIILLSTVNSSLALILIFLERQGFKSSYQFSLISLAVFLVLTSSWLFIFKRDQLIENSAKRYLTLAKQHHIQYSYLEDDVSSVVAISDSKFNINELIVNGVPITRKVLETKLMAHLPIAIHPHPDSFLAICFGMGTTYRSALKEGMKTDAVELSPAVVKMFPLFYPDAQAFLDNKGKIIINDGRNYVNLTHQKYDIVTIDPPPPVNAAGTTVLYSEEFYKNLLQTLNPGGIVSQWVYFGSHPRDLQMITKSFIDVFSQVLVIKPPTRNSGIFLIGSLSPIQADSSRINQIFSSEIVQKDLAEIGKRIDPKVVPNWIVGDRSSLLGDLQNIPTITDDHPITEYFLLRLLL